MVFEVELRAYKNGEIREVEVPDQEIKNADPDKVLERIFFWGQNDFQPRKLPSVSVGDVVRLDGKKYLVAALGFTEVSGEYPLSGMDSIMDGLAMKKRQ